MILKNPGIDKMLSIIQLNEEKYSFPEIMEAISNLLFFGGQESSNPNEIYPQNFLMDCHFAWHFCIFLLRFTDIPEEIQKDLIQRIMESIPSLRQNHQIHTVVDTTAGKNIQATILSFIPPFPEKRPFYEVAEMIIREDPNIINHLIKNGEVNHRIFTGTAYLLSRYIIPENVKERLTNAIYEMAIKKDQNILIARAYVITLLSMEKLTLVDKVMQHLEELGVNDKWLQNLKKI